ncbi:hypothetical protein [uncultured Campylobacter sp.]|uniref:hypothetical protein n=1 Tax=uncultured Campylobacter sp. TaxID=218934 RepID=UPI0026048929|nr:hypothetical protein [uncultured Campylobacter sp.]
MAENEHPDHLMCPFCGKDDIKYGAIVCGGCQAEISYSRAWFLKFLIGVVCLVFGIRVLIRFGFLIQDVFLISIGTILVLYSFALARDHSPEFHRTMEHVE